MNVYFVIAIILVCLLLATASVTSAISASDIYNTPSYNTNEGFQTAHGYLVIAAILGFSSLTVLLIILIVGGYAGDFTQEEISLALLNKPVLTPADVKEIKEGEAVIESQTGIQLLIMIIFILIILVTLVVGGLAAAAAIHMAGDNVASAAYSQAIIAASTALGGTILLIIAVIAFASIRSFREKELVEAKAKIKS